VGRFRFKDRDELLSYLSQAFPLEKFETGHRVTISRKGKYRRLNEEGEQVFTFGDPLLDLITDEHGWLTVGAERVILASRNPATAWFYDGSAKMRFRAFKKNYYAGWKMGADIETWGRDFTRAEIQSDYGFWVFGRACGVAKHDSDNDTNDDYVDEYEWGVFSPAPNGINSLCTATWGGASFSRYVSKGDCDYWI